MRIVVCVKHIPDTAAGITVVGGRGIDETVKFVMNPHDEYALEEAVRIVGREGGEVTAVTIGKDAASATLRAALAAGADRGVHVRTDTLFTDSYLKSLALRKVLEPAGVPDLIFTGKQSVDSEGMQLAYWLAAAFDIPLANEVVALSLTGRTVTVEREIGVGEREVIEMTLPCVIGAARGLNEPRYPKMMDIMKAKQKPVQEVRWQDLGLDPAAAKTELVRLEPVPDRGRARIIEGGAAQAADALVELLKTEAKVL